jgi:hypothetical protein
MICGTPVYGTEPSGPATDDSLISLAKAVGSSLPDDYLSAMRTSDGFGGAIGAEDGPWLHLYSCRDALSFQEGYGIDVEEPSLYLLGSSGGGMAYFIDRSNLEWVELPFLDIGDQGLGRLERRFTSFSALIEALVNDEP